MNIIKINILFLFVFFSLTIKAQSVQTHSEIPVVEEKVIVINPDEMPEFPGGTTALLNFIKTNVQYPKVIVEKTIHGTVYVAFIVDIDGNTKDIKVLKGIKDCAECDEEAKRLVSIMPKWKPGKQNGKPTPVHFNLPIKFQAQ